MRFSWLFQDLHRFLLGRCQERLDDATALSSFPALSGGAEGMPISGAEEQRDRRQIILSSLIPSV